MFCPKCGEIVSDFARTCPCCNASLRGGRSKVNKDCDHRHAQPDTVESPGSWQNPAKWDDPKAQIRLFGQTITREKAEAFRKSFNRQGMETFSRSLAGERPSGNKTEEAIFLLRQFFLHYRDFSGRTGRRDFWITTAVVFFGSLFLTLLFPTVGVLASLAVLLPSIAMGVRRLHDTGKSGKAMLMGLFPYFGFILLLVWYCQPSAPSNLWGPRPRF